MYNRNKRNKIIRNKTDPRTPLPLHTLMDVDKEEDSGMYIDDQFKKIIDRQCPGKLNKLLLAKAKKRVNTQPSLRINHQNEHQMQIFQRTFYKQRLKTAEKDRRAESMRSHLKKILKLDQRPPSPFFKLQRKTIIGLQQSSLLRQKKQKNGKAVFLSSKQTKWVHPYMKIIQNVYETVSQEFSSRPKLNLKRIVDFSPFGDVQPIDIHY